MEDARNDTQYSAPAAACAARILLFLAQVNESQSLANIARDNGSTKSLVFRVIRELERAELVRKIGDNGYQLGLAALELGAAVASRFDHEKALREILRSISEETGQTINLGVLRDFDVLFVMKQEAPRAVVTISHVGQRLPANCSALGKTLLAQLTDEEIHAIMPDPLPHLTSKSPTDPEVLLKDVQEARERGYGLDHESAILGRAALAVPLKLPLYPDLPAALAATASLDDFEHVRDMLLDALKRARARIERINLAQDALLSRMVEAASAR